MSTHINIEKITIYNFLLDVPGFLPSSLLPADSLLKYASHDNVVFPITTISPLCNCTFPVIRVPLTKVPLVESKSIT